MPFNPVIELSVGAEAASGNPVTLTWPSQPEAGWLLIASMRLTSTSREFVMPSGWSALREANSDTDDVVLAWKFAGSDEPVTVDFSSSPDNNATKVLSAVAYSGVPASVPASGFAVTGLTDTVTTISVGPTDPPGVDNALAVAAFAASRLGESGSVDDLTDGFGNWDAKYDATGFTSSGAIAHKTITDGSAQSVSTVIEETASRGGAVLALFVEGEGNGGDPDPVTTLGVRIDGLQSPNADTPVNASGVRAKIWFGADSGVEDDLITDATITDGEIELELSGVEVGDPITVVADWTDDGAGRFFRAEAAVQELD